MSPHPPKCTEIETGKHTPCSGSCPCRREWGQVPAHLTGPHLPTRHIRFIPVRQNSCRLGTVNVYSVPFMTESTATAPVTTKCSATRKKCVLYFIGEDLEYVSVCTIFLLKKDHILGCKNTIEYKCYLKPKQICT